LARYQKTVVLELSKKLHSTPHQSTSEGLTIVRKEKRLETEPENLSPTGVPRGASSRRAFVAFGLATFFFPRLGTAQNPASKPIKLMVGFAPGGSADFVARLIAPRLATAFGAVVVVENKPGASGTIAVAHVAKSAPDGTTLLMGSASPVVIAPQTLEKAPFNALTDLVAINTVGLTPQVIAVSASSGIRTLKDLLTLARTRQVSLASSGTGGMTHLSIELLIRASGSNIVHVPYKGSGPAISDTLAGHVHGLASDATPLLPLLQDGRLVALAVTSEQRVDFLSDVPTVSEEFPGFAATNWSGVLAPVGTPKALIDRINAGLVSVVANNDVRTQLRKAGFVPGTMVSPEAFQKFVAEDFARWGKLIKELNIVTKE
jgi:tripartite-type tricarboxylate transporter receptor subunit TctC